MLSETLHQSTETKGTTAGNTFPIGPDAVKHALGDRYEILEEIGHGGMATVYKAIERSLNRFVAIKVLHQNLGHDKEFVSRFHKESQLCAWLNHPNIIAVYDYGVVSGVHFIVMHYLEGSTLQAVIDRKKHLSLEEAWQYLLPIAQALDHAHARGIIHRDIKSSNIFITQDNRPVLLDFGIARTNESTNLTKSGVVFGTPDYLSPEQVEGKTVDHRTDVYSLGVVLYQCLTGSLPFKSDNIHTTLYRIVHQEPVNPSELNPAITGGIELDILRSLKKEPNKRFITAIDFCYKLDFRLRELATNHSSRKTKSAEMTGLTLIRNALSGRFKVYDFMTANVPLSTRFVNSPVIRAYDLDSEALCVLKIRDDFMCQFPPFYDVLLEAASKWQKLNHPNIVKIYEESSLGGIYYLAMEYLHGRSLREYIREQGPLGIHESIRILLPALKAVHFLHDRGIQHRRILAKNIFITAEGRIVVLDYGISHAFDNCSDAHAEKLWTGHWADASPLLDITGFGLVMIQCLTGFYWFKDTEPYQDLFPIDWILDHTYTNYYEGFLKQFNSPQWLSEILYKAIFWQDENRYTDIADMIYDLEQNLKYLPE